MCVASRWIYSRICDEQCVELAVRPSFISRIFERTKKKKNIVAVARAAAIISRSHWYNIALWLANVCLAFIATSCVVYVCCWRLQLIQKRITLSGCLLKRSSTSEVFRTMQPTNVQIFVIIAVWGTQTNSKNMRCRLQMVFRDSQLQSNFDIFFIANLWKRKKKYSVRFGCV